MMRYQLSPADDDFDDFGYEDEHVHFDSTFAEYSESDDESIDLTPIREITLVTVETGVAIAVSEQNFALVEPLPSPAILAPPPVSDPTQQAEEPRAMRKPAARAAMPVAAKLARKPIAKKIAPRAVEKKAPKAASKPVEKTAAKRLSAVPAKAAAKKVVPKPAKRVTKSAAKTAPKKSSKKATKRRR